MELDIRTLDDDLQALIDFGLVAVSESPSGLAYTLAPEVAAT